MTAQISPDSLHRLVKHAIDSGAATSVAEAEALFRGYRLTVEIDGAAANEPVQQAALLTTVALGRRVFLGGVTIAGALEEPLKLAMPLGRTLGEAVRALGGLLDETILDAPTIEVGRASCRDRVGQYV